MAFITYQFDSPSQFYAELKDVLEEGGFHDGPEAQVNSYISLIVQHQDEFMDAAGQDLTQCCYRLFDSDAFSQNILAVTGSIIERAIQSPVEKDMWVTYHVLLHAGKEFPKVYYWMLRSEFFAKLKYQIMQQEALVDEQFLHYLLDLVELTREDAYESLNYGTIKLLLTFNEQYMLNMSNRANYTPSGAKLTYSGNPLLIVLTERPGASCTFGENLIFMLNRADETALQMLILKLLYLLFTSPTLYDFFYTNDLHVLVDVVIRELWNLPEEEEGLRHAYLRVMGPLLTNTQLQRATYKRAEIVRVLRELGGGDLDTTLRLQLQEQQLREQRLEQSRAATAKMTYRDRESSASPAIRWANTSACPSPVLAVNNVKNPHTQQHQHQQRTAVHSKLSSGNNHSSSASLEVPHPEGAVRHSILEGNERTSSSDINDIQIVVPPMLERQNSQPRSASPTTQRLVERVLREWLDNEMKNGGGTTGVGLSVRDVTDGHVPTDQRIEIPVAQ
ncbi:hypothetical protein BGZ94_008863 [Podila epigama]|nr:hypothetical protein BGZ94_008863 [Podila epigama]